MQLNARAAAAIRSPKEPTDATTDPVPVEYDDYDPRDEDYETDF